MILILCNNSKIENDRGIAGNLSNLAGIAVHFGDLDRAWDLCAESLELDKKSGYRLGIAGTLERMGDIRREQGRFDDALDLYRRALKVHGRLADPEALVRNLYQVVSVCIAIGDTERANEYCREAFDQIELIDDEETADQLREQLQALIHDRLTTEP